MEIWHNPRCSKSRATLGLIEESGVTPDVRRYLDDPPSADELRRVLGLLGMEPWELVRRGEDAYRELGMAGWARTDDTTERWIEAMVDHPRLIERPVVVDGDRAVLGRPPEDVRALLG
jgi:arsenate reductase (glutaredoxin)